MNRIKNEKTRYNIIVISINAGIITLIEPNGEIGYYRQRKIDTLPNHVIAFLIQNGRLDRLWQSFKELPLNYTIEFEDKELMGRAYATYNMNRV